MINIFKNTIFQTLTVVSDDPKARYLPFLEKTIDYIIFSCLASRLASHYNVKASKTLIPLGPNQIFNSMFYHQILI